MEIYRNRPTDLGSRYNGSVDMRAVVEKLNFPRPIQTEANDRARKIICDEFANIFGKQPVVSGAWNNIVMGDPQTARVLVGAHYDTVATTPGADDNSSALAVMLRIASNLSAEDDVCFVAFNCEEFGLLGSKDFVNGLVLKGHQLQQVHILEMVGYKSIQPNSQENPLPIPGLPTVGDFIGVVSNKSLIKTIMQHANKINVPLLGLTLPDVPLQMIEQMAVNLLRSDHYPFWIAGILDAAMWTDTANFRNPNYHEPTDTPDTLDYEFMAAVGDVILDVINGA
jgi:hypothetical protein